LTSVIKALSSRGQATPAKTASSNTAIPGESETNVVDSSSTPADNIAVAPPSLIETFRDKKDNDDDDDSEPDLWVEPDPLSPETSFLNRSSSPSNQPADLSDDHEDNVVDADLLAALLSFGIDSDQNDEINELEREDRGDNLDKENNASSDYDDTLTGTLSASPLPDIELDFGDDNFLIDPDQLENLFDEDPSVEEENTDIGGDIHLIDDREAEALVDQDTEELYRELANLSIQPSHRTEDFLPQMENTGFEEDDLPPYMYCQPCTPESEFFDPLPTGLGPIGEEEQLASMQVNRQPNLMAAADEFRALLQENPEAVNLLQLDEDDDLLHQMEAYPELRPHAREAAGPFIEAFGLVDNADDENTTKQDTKSKQRSCFTHRETIYGITFSECGRFCASASQDSTICIWHVPTNSLLAQFKDHDKAYECLRVAWASEQWASHILDRTPKTDFAHLVASSGADGVVKLWACPDPLDSKNEWKCVYTLDHGTLAVRSSENGENKTDETKEGDNESGDEKEETKKPEDDKPQTYALAFIDHWQAFTGGRGDDDSQNAFLMTSSDEYIHFWEIETSKPEHSIELVEEDSKIRMVPDKIELKEVLSIHFSSLESNGFGVNVCSATGSGLQLPAPPSDTDLAQGEETGFGGDRNPTNKVFVFDAAYCKANGLLGVALSDGSLRLINGRGICISILNLPGCQSHLTSFCWDSTGTKLATSVATGHLITWKLDIGDVQGQGRTVATCTAIMEGGHQLGRPLFGSRYCGKDENLIVSWSVDGSLCLWDACSNGNVHAPIAVLKSDSEYPLYAVELSGDTIALGGGTEGGFIGVPFYLYTIERQDETNSRSPNPKRSTKSIKEDDEAKDIPNPDKKSKNERSTAD
jgi:WD40 repeat protein